MGKVGSYNAGVGSVSLRTVLVGTIALVVGLLAATFASASHVEPIPGPSNPQAGDCPAGSVGWKYEPILSGSGLGDGTLVVSVTITETELGDTFSFSSNLPIVTVFVKGGTVSNRYDYNPAVTSDSGLHSPLGAGPGGSKYLGLSHLVFCYTPPPPTGDLTVIKRVVNDDGGEAAPGSWTMNVAGPSPLSFPGASDPGTTNEVDADSYTVTESGPSGYTLTYSGDCNAQGQVTVPAEGSATCILTNDDNDRPPPEKGSITVQKELIPDGYQPPQGGFVFSGALDAVLGDGEFKTVEVEPGSYAVTESLDGRPFWDLMSIVCDDSDSTGNLQSLTATFVVAAGEDVKCTFTNQKRSLIVVKKVTNPSGLEGSFDFTASYDQGGFTLSDGQEDTSPQLIAGNYSVTEDAQEGWELESATCTNGDDPSDIDLPPSTVVTCTFTNRPAPETGTVVIKKLTDPAGDQTEFEFEFGQGDDNQQFVLSDGGSKTFSDLSAATYGASEDTPEGWELTSAVCDDGSDVTAIDLDEGETVTCTLTNTKDEPATGTIIVEKQTSPDGAQDSFAFSGDAEGTIGDGQQIVVGGLEPGEYTSTESEASGWLLTAIECDDEESSGDVASRTATFRLDAGQTITCVFTNAQQVVGKGSIDVQKSANPTTLKEPGGDVQFSVRITNTSNVNITVTNVVDDKFGDLDDSGGSGCFDVPINLGPGAFATCQFTKPITGQGGYEHVNTVCADAVDQYGNPLKDCDDAKVTIAPRLIDLVIVKNATSPTQLNGTVNYSLSVTNKGPDTATNVVLADPAPAGIQYQSATPSQGTCAVGPALVTCQLGTLSAGQTVTIAITAKATAVGRHVNTATVTGDGGRETNPADNTDSAETVVPAPVTPPVKPTPPKVEVCASLTVTPKMIKADGKKDRVVAKVRSATKPMKGVKVTVRGGGVRKSGTTNAKGVAVIVVNPNKTGLITITAVHKGDRCGARRIGVVGVFLPPVTG